ncbi:MAG TPA: MFS transporter [Candidatus Rubrimentiphilum sp.]|nr:MFS transporter [Candidatus Rubrimentiphilum sp.]
MSSANAQVRRSIFSVQRFRQYYFGQSFSLFGDGFRLLAIPLLVFHLSHSALSTGVAYLCELAPFALFSVIAGSLADRLNRRAVMLVSNAVRCAMMLLFAALYALHTLTVADIYAGLVVVAIAAALFLGGQTSSIPFLLGKERGTEATAALGGAENFANLVTPIIGGALFALFGALPALLITAAGYLASTIALWHIPSLGPDEASGLPSHREILSDIRTGFSLLFGDRAMRALAFAGLVINVLGFGAYAVLVPFLKRDFGASDRDVGIFFGISAAGAICGSILSTKFATRWVFGRALTTAYLIDAAIFLPVVLTRNMWVAGVFWALSNAVVQFEISQIIGFRLRVIREEYVGRVFGAVRLFVLCGIPPAAVGFGYAADHWGARLAMGISAAGYLLVALFVCTVPAIRAETR